MMIKSADYRRTAGRLTASMMRRSKAPRQDNNAVYAGVDASFSRSASAGAGLLLSFPAMVSTAL